MTSRRRRGTRWSFFTGLFSLCALFVTNFGMWRVARLVSYAGVLQRCRCSTTRIACRQTTQWAKTVPPFFSQFSTSAKRSRNDDAYLGIKPPSLPVVTKETVKAMTTTEICLYLKAKKDQHYDVGSILPEDRSCSDLSFDS